MAEDKIRVDNPTQNLESYFLDVVAKAKQAAAETSGATSGAQVAAYLRGDAEGRPVSSAEKVLERLTLPAAVEKLEPAKATSVEAPKLDEQKLAVLAKPAEPVTPAPVAASAPEPAKPVDLSPANEKLSSLLGKKP